MNASYEWLGELVPLKLTPAALRDMLTSRCATVDDLIQANQELRHIVVGKVVEAARHPNSDHLWITKVDAGGGTLLEVVCGAANVTAGTSYPFAPVGAVLPAFAASTVIWSFVASRLSIPRSKYFNSTSR